MASKFFTQRLFNVDEILRVHDQAKYFFACCGKFQDFDPSEKRHGQFITKGQLPELGLAKGISFGQLYIYEDLQTKQKSLNDLAEILNRSGHVLKYIEKLYVQVLFEEKNSQQTKQHSDTVCVGFANGKQKFSYSAVGSKTANDLSYRREFFQQLISDLKLPMELCDEGEEFSLRHTKGGELFVSCCNIYDRNPKMFSCEVSCESTAALYSLLEITLHKYGSGKCFEYSWLAIIGDLMRKRDECADVKDGYEMLKAQNFPAQKSDIGFAYYLDAIEGIETLRLLCGAKKNFLTKICSFSLPNKKSVTLTANTCSEGHRLEMYLSDIDCLAEIEEKLGLKFIECAK